MEFRNTNHVFDIILRNEQNLPDIGAQEARRHADVESIADVVYILDLRVGLKVADRVVDLARVNVGQRQTEKVTFRNSDAISNTAML